MSLPWSKFFWSDWESDPALKLCSLSAQGLWMRMLCIAAVHVPTGYVAINGRGLGVTDIARLAGVTETEARDLIGELDRNGVFSRDRKGTIYSRRLVRDAKKAEIARKNGKNGGNPSLWNGKGNQPSDNPPLKGRVKGGDKPQKPEARSQIPEKEPDGSSLPPNPLGRFALPDWVPEAEWLGFCEMRRRIKAPLTDRAKGGILRELEKLAEDGHPPGRVLDQSTTNAWRGVFPLKDGTDERALGRQQQPATGYRRDPAWERFKQLGAEFAADPDGWGAQAIEGG